VRNTRLARRTRPGGRAESYDLARRRGAGYDDYDILVFDSQADDVITAFPGSTGANRFGAGAVYPRTVLSVLTHDCRFDVPPLELVPTAGRGLHRQYGNTWVYAKQLVQLPRPVGTGSPVPLPSQPRPGWGRGASPGRGALNASAPSP
jgi:hypothetical protein